MRNFELVLQFPCLSKASVGLSMDNADYLEVRLSRQLRGVACHNFLAQEHAAYGQEGLPSISMSKLPSAVTVAGSSAPLPTPKALNRIATIVKNVVSCRTRQSEGTLIGANVFFFFGGGGVGGGVGGGGGGKISQWPRAPTGQEAKRYTIPSKRL